MHYYSFVFLDEVLGQVFQDPLQVMYFHYEQEVRVSELFNTLMIRKSSSIPIVKVLIGIDDDIDVSRTKNKK